MSLFIYICTKQSADVFIPPVPVSLQTLSRDVSDAVFAMQGGYLRVGQLAFLPLQKSLPNHLLCNGQEVRKDKFPELYEFLGDFMGAASGPDFFKLPNYVGGTLEPAPAAAPEVVQGGTVTSETSSPGTGSSGGSLTPAVDSGGRERAPRINSNEVQE